MRARDGRQLLHGSVVVGAGQRAEVADPASGSTERGAPADVDEGSGSGLGVGLLVGGGSLALIGGGLGVAAIITMSGAETPDDPAVGTARTLALITDIALPLGAVVAGIGLALLLFSGGEDESPDRSTTAAAVTLTPCVGRGFVGLGASGAF